MTARELTDPVSLVTPDGRPNPDAVGWARHPLVDTSGIGRRPRRRWGRTKRWEYWNVLTPTHILALTVSSIDYAAVHEVWVFERATRRERHANATVLPARGVQLPPRLDAGRARARAKGLEIDIEPIGALQDAAARRVRLRAAIAGAAFDVTVTRPAGHECLAVVVPFGPTRFQYTVKDVALPAAGTLTLDGVTCEVPAGSSWAVLDHGRGWWPYDVRWNWGAGSGVCDGRTIGVQVGGRWTDGTGQTENGLVVDGRLHKIHDDLRWEYDRTDWLRPWRVSGGGLEASFTPFYDKRSATNLGVISSRTDQCFGTWAGTWRTADGEQIAFEGIEGWAEDVHNRW
ncbi:DUF2804 domain-containing protein [Microbacterium luticocti]|uniref:DUF2804 domain-containing protein n=1 Tax=Microbacterium luticocti TaxID=451764 RepID=UPI0003F952EC|nr:DUF2804 domain-containing protein [Microbacterium luticocti]